MGKGKNLAMLPKRANCEKYVPQGQTFDGNGYYSLFPSWKFSEAWRGDPSAEKVEFFGSVEIQKQGQHLIEGLAKFEGKKWSEILVVGKKMNHEIDVAALSKEAKRIMQKFQPNMDRIVSLRFSGEERVFGKIDRRGAFAVLFWDPKHKICPSQLKHT